MLSSNMAENRFVLPSPIDRVEARESFDKLEALLVIDESELIDGERESEEDGGGGGSSNVPSVFICSRSSLAIEVDGNASSAFSTTELDE